MSDANVPSPLYNQSFNAMIGKTVIGETIAVIAPIALFFSVLIIFTIWRTKDLHNKSHYVIASLAMAEAIYNAQMIIWTVRLAIRIRDSTPLIVPSWLCTLNSQLTYVPSEAASILCVSLGIDRLLCVAAPIYYKKVNAKKYILIMNVLAYTWNLPLILIGMIGTDISAMWNCESSVLQQNSIVNTLRTQLTTNIVTYLVVILYISSASVLLYRYKRAALNTSSNSQQQRSEWRRRWEIRIFVSMAIVGLSEVLMQAIARGIPTFFSSVSNVVGITLAMRSVSAVLIQVVAILHLFVYLAIDTEFRKGFKNAFAFKKCGHGAVLPV